MKLKFLFLMSSMLFFNYFFSQRLVSFSENNIEKTVFSGNQNLIFLNITNLDSSLISIRINEFDSAKAKIAPAIKMGYGYYYLTPKEDYEGSIDLIVFNRKDLKLDHVLFQCRKLNESIYLTLSGNNNSETNKNDIINFPYVGSFILINESLNYSIPKLNKTLRVINCDMILFGEKTYNFKFSSNQIPSTCLEAIKKLKAGDMISIDATVVDEKGISKKAKSFTTILK